MGHPVGDGTTDVAHLARHPRDRSVHPPSRADGGSRRLAGRTLRRARNPGPRRRWLGLSRDGDRAEEARDGAARSDRTDPATPGGRGGRLSRRARSLPAGRAGVLDPPRHSRGGGGTGSQDPRARRARGGRGHGRQHGVARSRRLGHPARPGRDGARRPTGRGGRALVDGLHFYLGRWTSGSLDCAARHRGGAHGQLSQLRLPGGQRAERAARALGAAGGGQAGLPSCHGRDPRCLRRSSGAGRHPGRVRRPDRADRGDRCSARGACPAARGRASRRVRH